MNRSNYNFSPHVVDQTELAICHASDDVNVVKKQKSRHLGLTARAVEPSKHLEQGSNPDAFEMSICRWNHAQRDFVSETHPYSVIIDNDRVIRVGNESVEALYIGFSNVALGIDEVNP